MTPITLILGDEFDDSLREKLFAVLRGLDATVVGTEGHVVAGSQDFERMEVMVGQNVICIEAETYIGLSISGPPELVRDIQKLILG